MLDSAKVFTESMKGVDDVAQACEAAFKAIDTYWATFIGDYNVHTHRPDGGSAGPGTSSYPNPTFGI